MSDIFAMQRANGDWFALDHDGRLRVPLPGEDEVDFCIVDDPFASLNRGSTVGLRQLASLIRPDEHENDGTRGNASSYSDLSALPNVTPKATETWEDEGSTHGKPP